MTNVTDRSIDPFPKLQLSSTKIAEVVNAGMLAITKESTTAHPLESVDVTVYVPAESPEISSVVSKLLQEKLNGVLPPVVLKLIEPSPKSQFSSF